MKVHANAGYCLVGVSQRIAFVRFFALTVFTQSFANLLHTYIYLFILRERLEQGKNNLGSQQLRGMNDL